MRLINIISFSLAGFLAIYCLAANDIMKQEPNGKSSDSEKKIDSMQKELEERTKQIKSFQNIFEEARKERDEFEKQFYQRQEERAQQMKKSVEEFASKQKEFDQSAERFENKFRTKKEGLQQEFNQKQEEFNVLRDQFLEKLKKHSPNSNQEKEETESLQRHLQEEIRVIRTTGVTQASSDRQCQNCNSNEKLSLEAPKIFVFISFSVPETIWVSLSKELEKSGGAFVLRGLPEQSFQTFAGKILKLRERGVNAPIQLDPKSFAKYEVSQVPSFVIADEQAFDKVSGNISLQFALELMASKGETKAAKAFYQTLKEKV